MLFPVLFSWFPTRLFESLFLLLHFWNVVIWNTHTHTDTHEEHEYVQFTLKFILYSIASSITPINNLYKNNLFLLIFHAARFKWMWMCKQWITCWYYVENWDVKSIKQTNHPTIKIVVIASLFLSQSSNHRPNNHNYHHHHHYHHL